MASLGERIWWCRMSTQYQDEQENIRISRGLVRGYSAFSNNVNHESITNTNSYFCPNSFNSIRTISGMLTNICPNCFNSIRTISVMLTNIYLATLPFLESKTKLYHISQIMLCTNCSLKRIINSSKITTSSMSEYEEYLTLYWIGLYDKHEVNRLMRLSDRNILYKVY